MGEGLKRAFSATKATRIKQTADKQIDVLLDVLEDHTSDRGRFLDRDTPRKLVRKWLREREKGE